MYMSMYINILLEASGSALWSSWPYQICRMELSAQQQQQTRRTSRTSSHEQVAGTRAAFSNRAAFHGDDAEIEISKPTPPEADSRRCWICFEEEYESDIKAKGSASEWRSPCRCSLMAHEECLVNKLLKFTSLYWSRQLTWVDETQKSSMEGINSSKTIKCPQCKEPYRIRSEHSLSVALMSFADSWISRCLLATIPLGFLRAVGITCFYYGQGAMLDVLGEDRLTDLILSLKPGDEVRFLIGASAIPFSLIGARFDLFNFVLPLIPSLVCFSDGSFIQSKKPMESSPALWICVLPWLRNLYCFGWKKLIRPSEIRWKAEAGLLKENYTELAPGIDIRFLQEDNNQGRDENNQDAAVADANAAAEDQAEDAIAHRWVSIEAPKFARMIAGALLLPKISVYACSFLEKIPYFKKRYPHKFQRVILSGTSFVLIKDMLSLLYLYNRAKGRATRHIVNRKAPRPRT